MSINSIENAVRYSQELDKMFAQKSATGFFADNALKTKFVGAKTVIIPDIDFQGLADYDRDTGFTRGAITVSNTSYTMKMDRARSLQIDREDLDETGVAKSCIHYTVNKGYKLFIKANLALYLVDKGNKRLIRLCGIAVYGVSACCGKTCKLGYNVGITLGYNLGANVFA